MPHADEQERHAEHVYIEQARLRRRQKVVEIIVMVVIALAAIWLCNFVVMSLLFGR